MEISVTAIYEDGILRLLTPLALPEHSRVQVRIEALESPPAGRPEPIVLTDKERDRRLYIVRQLYGIWSEKDESNFYRLRQEMWSQWQPRDLS